MNHKKLALRGAAAVGTFLLGTALQAQPLSNPIYFDLPVLNVSGGQSTSGVASTFQIGEVDPSVKSAVGGAPLNDLEIMNSSVFNGTDLVIRMYTLRHDSATNTQSLALQAPDDILIGQECIPFSSSLQLADINGDGANDAVFASGSCQQVALQTLGGEKDFGFMSQAGVFGIAGTGSASGPFFTGSPIFLGGQSNASLPTPLVYFADAAQPVIAAAEFRNGSGVDDIVFYNFDFPQSGPPLDLVRILENNGSLAPLPDFDRTIQGPYDTTVGQDTGTAILAGDFDGDGNQDVALLFQGNLQLDSFLRVYLGDGAGGFNATPAADVDLGANQVLHGFASGDFDGNAFSDFAVLSNNFPNGSVFSNLNIVTCAPGSPATCSIAAIPLDPTTQNVGISATTADFNGDGFDDVAVSKVFEGPGGVGQEATSTNVLVYLNQGGSFGTSPDQTMTLNLPMVFEENVVPQVIAKEIDACGGPDLAFIGFGDTGVPQGGGIVLEGLKSVVSGAVKNGTSLNAAQQVAVAFNPNEAPVADAGSPQPANNGVIVGGNPTCSDPTGDAVTAQWQVVSGQATFSDPVATNPIVTNATGGTVLQVTCTDACGASSTDTVTLSSPSFIEGAGCSLAKGTTSPLGFVGMGLVFLLTPALRFRRDA